MFRPGAKAQSQRFILRLMDKYSPRIMPVALLLLLLMFSQKDDALASQGKWIYTAFHRCSSVTSGLSLENIEVV